MPDIFAPRHVSLLPHPGSRVGEHFNLRVELQEDRLDGAIPALRLTYRISAVDLLVPAPTPPTRSDGLWQHTCAELFVGVDGASGYRELNFSPSGQWAAYDFSAYRQRTEVLPELRPPQIVSTVSGDGLVIMVRLALDAVTLDAVTLEEFSHLRWALTSVLEHQDGTRSYWAITHPQAQPDFHHRDGFVLALL